MEDKKMDAVDRALLFLAKATYKNHGAEVVVRIVSTNEDGHET